ncbi:2-hydroxyacid dehydrogenase [Pseudorhodoferax sp.]|uniref:2-hydroxyacid dehydrogenase n=1 Tax=Pseudorhodoferax sp. TaxID=1993553 RepID=UPI002DD67357|nr:2-hydroxyacid dehydrogenase [Pseudorhodoferax sp.]
MAHRLLIQQGALPPALQTRLQSLYDTQLLPQPGPARDDFLATHGQGAVALATNARFGCSAELAARLPDLRVVSSLGVGLDAIDLPALHARGIAVGYTPEVLNDCVADIAFALLMAAARRVTAADAFVRRGDWTRGQFPMGTRVSGKRLGILGMGRIGAVVARRAIGFDMEVRYHNRRPAAGSTLGYAATPTELAAWADFLVVVTAGGPETRNLVSREVLDALGPKGFLVNVSRGSVVDEAALIDSLQQRRIAGAGLDVFAHEPEVPEALRSLDNVVLLPHIASNTEETRAAMTQRVEDNLAAFFAGRTLPSAA